MSEEPSRRPLRRGLKPSALADEAIASIMEMLRQAEEGIGGLEELVFAYGEAPLKVYFLMWRQSGWVSLAELERLGAVAGMPSRSVRYGLRALLDDGYAVHVGAMYRLAVRNGR